MYRKVAIVGATAAAIVGCGGAALAVTGSSGSSVPATADQSSAPSPSSTSGASGTAKRHPALRAVARHAVHGQVVTANKDGGFVTHDFARGKVTGVSTKLIVVHTADGTSQSFIVSGQTKVRVRTDGKGTAGSITDVHVGDTVVVSGVGTSNQAARHVIDLGTK